MSERCNGAINADPANRNSFYHPHLTFLFLLKFIDELNVETSMKNIFVKTP